MLVTRCLRFPHLTRPTLDLASLDTKFSKNEIINDTVLKTKALLLSFVSQSENCYCLHSVQKRSLLIYEALSDLKDRIFSFQFSSVQFRSVAQSCPTLCNPMNRSTPGLPVHHQLPEFTQTHVHGVCDAIQPSHPRSSPSPPAPNPSQHQSLFQ